MSRTIVDGIIFDLDNTLLDRQYVFLVVAHAFCVEHLGIINSSIKDDVVAKMICWDEDGYSDREEMLERWLTEWPETGFEINSLTTWYLSVMEEKIQPDMVVNRFLAGLNDLSIPWGIVTNGRSSLRDRCRATGLDQLAPFIIVSEEVGYEKPDARIFRDALDAVGLRNPHQAVFVGDNPEADIDGAKTIGMKTVWIRPGRRYPMGFHVPDHIIEHVTQL